MVFLMLKLTSFKRRFTFKSSCYLICSRKLFVFVNFKGHHSIPIPFRLCMILEPIYVIWVYYSYTHLIFLKYITRFILDHFTLSFPFQCICISTRFLFCHNSISPFHFPLPRKVWLSLFLNKLRASLVDSLK
jgi:hypothetical protein